MSNEYFKLDIYLQSIQLYINDGNYNNFNKSYIENRNKQLKEKLLDFYQLIPDINNIIYQYAHNSEDEKSIDRFIYDLVNCQLKRYFYDNISKSILKYLEYKNIFHMKYFGNTYNVLRIISGVAGLSYLN